MARDLREVFREAFELPEHERATLAGLLIESIEDPPDPDVEEQWAIEAERRWREIESNEVQTIPWEEVRAKLFRRG
jgi:putative addiction module component (TIGR02574 family)